MWLLILLIIFIIWFLFQFILNLFETLKLPLSSAKGVRLYDIKIKSSCAFLRSYCARVVQQNALSTQRRCAQRENVWLNETYHKMSLKNNMIIKVTYNSEMNDIVFIFILIIFKNLAFLFVSIYSTINKLRNSIFFI